MSEQGHALISGEPVAARAADEAAEELEASLEPTTEVDDFKRFRTPGFQRMRTKWRPEDADVISWAKSVTEGRLIREFYDLYAMIERIYNVVRKPVVDDNGEILTDQYGRTIWAKDDRDLFIEDFSLLTYKEREQFLFQLTTNLIFWKQQAADAWGEAMLSKTQWIERFSHGFDSGAKGTDERRKAMGNLDSRDEHYFAVFLTWYSKKAEALVDSVELLGQRIKDSMNT